MNDKKSTYEVITDRILELLEQGVAPWQKPWKSICLGDECGAFFNLKTKRPYSGTNVWVLMGTPFTSPYFLTFNQCKSMGGMVRKGEHGTPIIFWKRIQIEDKESPTGKKTIPLLRHHTVFNVEQCDGLEDKIPHQEEREATPEEAEQVKSDAVKEAIAIVENMPKCPEIHHGGNRASYSPSFDRVRMPEQTDFVGCGEYYSTLFHELVHATGHESRLARKGVMGTEGNWTPFGSPAYAKEELVAEMGAAFLCGIAGIENTLHNSAGYIDHWKAQLKADPKLFIHAAGAAQRAADFVLARGSGKEASTERESNESLTPDSDKN